MQVDGNCYEKQTIFPFVLNFLLKMYAAQQNRPSFPLHSHQIFRPDFILDFYCILSINHNWYFTFCSLRKQLDFFQGKCVMECGKFIKCQLIFRWSMFSVNTWFFIQNSGKNYIRNEKKRSFAFRSIFCNLFVFSE